MDPLEILSALGGPAREIVKSLTGTKGAGTDLSALTGAGALRVENLDPVLFSVTVENKHFDLFNRLLPHKRDSFSMLDQQIIKKGIGGFPGSAFSTEQGTGRPDRQGDYQRLLTELGVFMDRRSVSLVTALQGVLQNRAGATNFSTVSEENVNAALTLLETIEWGLFYGDRTVSTYEINGLQALIQNGAAGNVIDMKGTTFSDHTQLADLAQRIAKRPQFGKPDLLYTSSNVKYDLDKSLISGYRVNLDTAVPNTVTGVPVKGFNYSAVGIGQGYAEIIPHAYVEENKVPVEVTNPNAPTLTAPTVACAAVAPTVANSSWINAQAGAYYYRVEAWSAGQVSPTAVTVSAATVAAGGAIDVTITAGGTETYYAIYRGRLGGTNAASDMRLVARVAKTGGTTVWRDLNTTIPGTSEVFMLTSAPNLNAMTWLQMLPLTQFPLAQTDASLNWLVMLLGALRVPDARKHGVIRNVLPSNAAWKPFN